jgi:hypothetical protein
MIFTSLIPAVSAHFTIMMLKTFFLNFKYKKGSKPITTGLAANTHF